MKGRLLRATAPLVAAVLFAMAPNAKATTVTYNTVGSRFLPDVNGSVSGAVPGAPGSTFSATLSNDGGVATAGGTTTFMADATITTGLVTSGPYNLTLQYLDLPHSNVGLPADHVKLGQFSFSTTDPTVLAANELDGLQFDLHVEQSSPAGSGELVGDIKGSIFLVPGIDPTQDVDIEISFAPTTLYSSSNPSIAYMINPDPVVLHGNDLGIPATSFLTADLSVAPLPATASMGLTLIGACGIAGAATKLRRKEVIA